MNRSSQEKRKRGLIMSRDEKMYWENQRKRHNKKEKEDKRKFVEIPLGYTGQEVSAYYLKHNHC